MRKRRIVVASTLLFACRADGSSRAHDASPENDAGSREAGFMSPGKGVMADECSDPRADDCGAYANYSELAVRADFGCHWKVDVGGDTVSEGNCASASANQFFYRRTSDADPCRSTFQLSGRSEDGRTTMNASMTKRGKWSEAEPFMMQATGRDRSPQLRSVDRSQADFSLRIGVSGDADFLSVSCGISQYLAEDGSTYDEVALPSNSFSLQVQRIEDVCWAERDYEQYRLTGSLRGSCVASRTSASNGVMADFVVSFGRRSKPSL